MTTKQLKKSSFLLLFIILMTIPELAMAGMPWENGLQNLLDGVKSAAKTISILGIIGAGGMLIWGGAELGNFIKTILYIILVISVMLGASDIIGLI